MIRFILPLFLFAPLAAPAAQVVKVYDGDTVTVRDNGREIRVRFACVDAPEMSQAPHGQVSRDHLAKIIPVGSEVKVEVKTKDQYGRVVGEIFKDGESVNLRMVEEGQAFVWAKFADQCGASKFLAAESAARTAKRGVWRHQVQKPWQYRYDNR